MRKRIMSLLLCMVMALSLLPAAAVTAFAEETGKAWTYPPEWTAKTPYIMETK